MAWLIAAALVLAVLSGLAASAEVALLRVSLVGIEPAPPHQQRASRPVRAALSDPASYLSLLVLVRVASATAATALVVAAMLRWLGPVWQAYLSAAAVTTAVLYVLLGLWPRTVGRRYEQGLLRASADVLYPLARVLGPLPRWLLAAGSMLTPGRAPREGGLASEEELRGLVDLLERRRVIQPGERRMIHSVFELGETIAREVMVPRPDIVFIEHDKTVGQVLSLALRSGFSRIPVLGENEDDVVGIAYLKDLVAHDREHPQTGGMERVEKVMRPATFVPESKPVDALLREMQARQTHLAIVIDEYGGTAGLVTIEDILEEIVGEIADEYDQEQPTVNWLAPGRARVTARLPVTDLEELFGVRIEVEDVETVGGLLAHALGRVPIAGSMATVAGLTLTAESRAGRRNRIGTVIVARAAAAPDGQVSQDGQGGAQHEPAPAEEADMPHTQAGNGRRGHRGGGGRGAREGA